MHDGLGDCACCAKAGHTGRADTSGRTGPQDLRRTAIYNLVEAGVNLAEVHQRFGFVSHLTLAVHYDHRELTAQRRSAWLTTELHDLGFQRRLNERWVRHIACQKNEPLTTYSDTEW